MREAPCVLHWLGPSVLSSPLLLKDSYHRNVLAQCVERQQATILGVLQEEVATEFDIAAEESLRQNSR